MFDTRSVAERVKFMIMIMIMIQSIQNFVLMFFHNKHIIKNKPEQV